MWVARGLYSSMHTMFTFVYDKENCHQRDTCNSWYVYIFTENALKRLHKLQFCLNSHIARLSNFASCFLICAWLNDTYNNSTATEKTSLVVCNNKGPDQPGNPRSLISNFVVCFLRRIIPRLASCEIISIFYLACLAEGTGLSETQKTGFLTSWPVLHARQL